MGKARYKTCSTCEDKKIVGNAREGYSFCLCTSEDEKKNLSKSLDDEAEELLKIFKSADGIIFAKIRDKKS